jgi:hypothetical protein
MRSGSENILDMRAADKGWSSSFEFGRGANNSALYKITMLGNVTKSSDLGGFFGKTNATENGQNIWKLELEGLYTSRPLETVAGPEDLHDLCSPSKWTYY